jgi:integrase
MKRVNYSMNIDYDILAKKLLDGLSGRTKEITLESFCKEMLVFMKRNRAEKTYEGVKLVCDYLMGYFSPLRKISSIGLRDAEQFLYSLKKHAPKGIYNYLRVLRATFNKAIEWNYIRENPFSKIKLERRQARKPIYITEDELKNILECIEAEVIKDFVVTAFYTGCRLGELVNLKWGNVDLGDNVLTIGDVNFQTKTRKQRVVPIHPRVRTILERRLKGHSAKRRGRSEKNCNVVPISQKDFYVFGKANGFKFTGDYFSKKFKKACRAAGMSEEVHFHCLRHGAATRMIKNGATIPAVQRILGHSSIQTTMIYTHPDLESLRDAVNRL